MGSQMRWLSFMAIIESKIRRVHYLDIAELASKLKNTE